MVIFERDIAVDLGTSSTLLFEQGKGIAAREPTVVAVDRVNGKILKVGQDAQKMLGRTPANIVAIRPVSAGVISDYEMAAQMLRELVGRLTSFSLFKPRVLACVPSSITGVEERAMIDAAIEAGARRVYLLETAVATAMGAGVDISKPDGHMIIDIGGGTTEIAIVSAGGVVECESIKVAGTSFDEAIVKYVRRKHNMLIGLTAAEELKRNIGCVMQRPDMGIEEARAHAASAGGRLGQERHHPLRRRHPALRHRPADRTQHRHPHHRGGRPHLLRGLRRGQDAQESGHDAGRYDELLPHAPAEGLRGTA